MKKKLFSEIPELWGERTVLKRLTAADTDSLRELVESPAVYRYLPTFLFEKRYPDVSCVIKRLYDEGLKESLVLGIFLGEEFCGLAEMYGYRDPIHKVSVGYRLLERCWGRGIAAEALGLMVGYLENETDIEIITASTMAENQRSARVLLKNGFTCVVQGVYEDWGYDSLTLADKWIR